ncbi:MAG: FAD-dependent oxidoreductase [Pirellulaceae bacterium]|jgi:NADH dehydrogenase FAD-containing subunit|nr:FAD-dependent oxidoreductase [Pirellulaceae bacterium]
MYGASDHQVVIVGGGFAGLCAAQSLRRAPVRATLIDRRNSHLFQPLLYQVATGGLSPADIASPFAGTGARIRSRRGPCSGLRACKRRRWERRWP